MPTPKLDIDKVILPNGEEAYKLTSRQAAALAEIISDRLWWQEAVKRARVIGLWAAGVTAGLALMASWWPWITRVAQFILQDVPQ